MENCNEIVVSIRDFQIIKKASLTFKPGLTAIIGQSNNGKSAIFRAIKSCVYNEPGATSIRNGCSSYLVGIQMNGHTVICQKGKNSMYKVDGVTYQKVGRTQLPEVAGSLNIRELNLNGSNEQINFWDQMEKPFLLDRSETELFRFIVDSGKDNNIMQASKSLVSDRQSITKEITMIEGMIAQSEVNVKSYEEKLANSDETLAICERVIKIGPEIQRLNDVKDRINRYNDSLLKSESNNNLLIETSNNLNMLEPNINKLNSDLSLSNVLNNLLDSYNNSISIIDKLNSNISSINDLEVSRLNEKFSEYKTITNIISNYREASNNLQECDSFIVPEVSKDFSNNIDNLNKLKNLIFDIEGKTNLLDNLKNEIVRIDESIVKYKEELDEIGICPTCGQPIHS